MECIVHGILQVRILEWPFPSPGHLPNPGIKPRSPALQADSLSAEPQGKPKNTGMGSLSFLQQIFPTQESNQGLLHRRWILYQLSYQGSTERYTNRNVQINEFSHNHVTSTEIKNKALPAVIMPPSYLREIIIIDRLGNSLL